MSLAPATRAAFRVDPEFAALIPPLTREERDQLEASLQAEGCRDALVLAEILLPPAFTRCKECEVDVEPVVGDGNWACPECDYGVAPQEWELFLLDGHNRFEICTRLGIPFDTLTHEGIVDRDQALDWIIDNQLGRRNLTPLQASHLRGQQYLREKRGHGGNRKSSTQCEDLKTSERLAAEHKVSRATIERDGQFAEAVDALVKVHGDTVRTHLLSGESKVSRADVLHLAKMDTPRQQEVVGRLVREEAVSLADARRQIAREAVKTLPVVEGKHRVLYADPPWQYGNTADPNYSDQDRHYPTMSLDQICALPVREWAEENAVLFLWATSPILEEAFAVLRAWGFTYKASFVWDKVRHNFGHYNSVRHEFLLVATRGACTPEVQKLYDSVVVAERTERHSEKPEVFREMIDSLYPSGARLELFARCQVGRWKAHGNQL